MQKNIATRGFTLIELMVAMTIGLFIVGGMVIAYTSGKQTYRVEEGISRLQENGRFALETIARDIRMADYNGCYSSTGTPTNTLNNSTSFAYNFAVGIEGNEATSVSAWSPVLDATISGASPPPLGGTDVITLRVARGAGVVPDTPYMNTNSADIHINQPGPLKQFDVVVISDCSGSSIFQITNINTSGAGNNVVHNTGIGTPGNATTDLGKTYKNDAEILVLETVTYFIAPSALAAGNNSLWRKTGTNAPQELAEGVDNLQVLYGEDTDADLTANKYVTANNVSNMKNVMSVRVSLLMRTTDNNLATQPQRYTYNGTTTTPADRRLRKEFTTIVNLRNHSL